MDHARHSNTLTGFASFDDQASVDEGAQDTSSTGTVGELTITEVVEESGEAVGGEGAVVAVQASEWVFDFRDGLADDVAQAVNEISDGVWRPGFLVPLVLASIGAAYAGIWLGDRILPFGRTTVGKAAGAVLGTILVDVIARRIQRP